MTATNDNNMTTKPTQRPIRASATGERYQHLDRYLRGTATIDDAYLAGIEDCFKRLWQFSTVSTCQELANRLGLSPKMRKECGL